MLANIKLFCLFEELCMWRCKDSRWRNKQLCVFCVSCCNTLLAKVDGVLSVVHRMDLEKQKNHLNEDIWLDITEIFFKDNCISDFPLHDWRNKYIIHAPRKTISASSILDSIEEIIDKYFFLFQMIIAKLLNLDCCRVKESNKFDLFSHFHPIF